MSGRPFFGAIVDSLGQVGALIIFMHDSPFANATRTTLVKLLLGL